VYASLAHALCNNKTETELTIPDFFAAPVPSKNASTQIIAFVLHRDTARRPSPTSSPPTPFPAPSPFTLLHNRSQYESPTWGGKVQKCHRTFTGCGQGTDGRFVEGGQGSSRPTVCDQDGGDVCFTSASTNVFKEASFQAPTAAFSNNWNLAIHPSCRLVKPIIDRPRLCRRSA
jgi:hypothetical protein